MTDRVGLELGDINQEQVTTVQPTPTIHDPQETIVDIPQPVKQEDISKNTPTEDCCTCDDICMCVDIYNQCTDEDQKCCNCFCFIIILGIIIALLAMST